MRKSAFDWKVPKEWVIRGSKASHERAKAQCFTGTWQFNFCQG